MGFFPSGGFLALSHITHSLKPGKTGSSFPDPEYESLPANAKCPEHQSLPYIRLFQMRRPHDSAQPGCKSHRVASPELYGLNYVIFRFFNIYGPHQKNGLIPTLYNRIINGEPLTIFGKGDQVRDYVFIEDIIPFFEKSCVSDVGKNSIFNMGTGKGTTIKEIIEILTKIIQIEPKIEFQPTRPGEIGNFVADTTQLKSSFDNIPNTTVVDGLKNTLDWLKHH